MYLHPTTMEQATNDFTAWLKANDVTVSPKVTIADLSDVDQGRGVVAVEDIKAEEVLFEIPLSTILNIDTCSLSKEVDNAKDTLLHLNQWEALIIILLYELKVKKEQSRWLSYFNVLPMCDEENYKFNQLIFWTDDELSKLSPSLIIDRVGKSQAQEMYEKLTKVISDLGLSVDVTLDDFQKVASVILSYSFDVDFPANDVDEQENESDLEILNDGYYKSMIPLADTLNADTEFKNANLVYTEKSLVMTSTKPIKKGEQVYNIYSHHPNSEILRRYGYVQHHGSKFDFGEIPMELIQKYFCEKYELSKETFDEVLEILTTIVNEENENNEYEDEVDIILDTYDCFKTHEVQTEFLFVIQILTVISLLTSSIQGSEDKSQLIKRIYKKCYQLVESNKLTNLFLENYKNILNTRLSSYPEIGDIPNEYTRETMAKVVLASEYQSLKNCLDIEKTLKTEAGQFKFIDDDKLIRNIIKKRLNADEAGHASKKSKN